MLCICREGILPGCLAPSRCATARATRTRVDSSDLPGLPGDATHALASGAAKASRAQGRFTSTAGAQRRNKPLLVYTTQCHVRTTVAGDALAAGLRAATGVAVWGSQSAAAAACRRRCRRQRSGAGPGELFAVMMGRCVARGQWRCRSIHLYTRRAPGRYVGSAGQEAGGGRGRRHRLGAANEGQVTGDSPARRGAGMAVHNARQCIRLPDAKRVASFGWEGHPWESGRRSAPQGAPTCLQGAQPLDVWRAGAVSGAAPPRRAT